MHRTATVLLALVLTALAGWALWPGIGGDFLFDDYVNLSALGQFGPVDNPRTLLWYLTVGLGDPLGRPLSMLSFLIDARDWPAPAAPFLRTNIVLHLINGLLLMRVLLALSRAHSRRSGAAATANLADASQAAIATVDFPDTAPRDASATPRSRLRRSYNSGDVTNIGDRAAIAAVLAGGLWMLHPLFISTTLYVVQRESMLAASFVLLGFLAWLAGRVQLERGARRRALALLLLGSVGCTSLAMLCKANGVLLPLLLLVAEGTVLPPLQGAAGTSLLRLRRWLLLLPSALLALGLLLKLPGAFEMARDVRPWTLGERLLSEPRVILDYLRLLLLPRPLAGGVFQDGYPVSTSPWQPWTTLPAIVLLAGLVALAWRQRRRWPMLSFALLFFLAGHVLEGSVIPLELYFEHRNYLPAMPLFWPLANWLVANGRMALPRWVAALALVLLLAFDTRLGATVWGQPARLAQEWAARDPASSRAQATAAQYELLQGRADAARARLRKALAARPDDAQLAFNLADAECALGGVDPVILAAMRHALQTSTNTARLGFDWLSRAVSTAQAGSCPGLDLDAVESLLQALRANPNFASVPARTSDFMHIEGLIALARGDAAAALGAFDRGIAILPRARTALRQAALLATAGRPDLGLEHLDGFRRLPQPSRHPWPTMAHVHAWLLQRDGYWEREVAHLRAQLAEDAAAMHPAGTAAHIPTPIDD